MWSEWKSECKRGGGSERVGGCLTLCGTALKVLLEAGDWWLWRKKVAF